MNKTKEILNRIGGSARVAEKLQPRVPETTVRGWRRSGSIPVKYWPSLILIAIEAGVPLTAEELMFAYIDSPLIAGDFGKLERARKAARSATAKPESMKPLEKRLKKLAEFKARSAER